MSTEQQHLHTAAVSHIRQCFNRIKQQVEQAGKKVARIISIWWTIFLPQATPRLPIRI